MRVAIPLGHPSLSKNLHGEISSKAIRHEKEKGINISRPTYKIAKIMTRHNSGFTNFEKTIEGEGSLQIPIL